MKVLVTGGAGFIGSHTCVELLNAGHEVVIVDNLSNSKEEAVDKIREITGKDLRFYRVDLLDRRELEDVFAQNPVGAVIHFAGYKAVGESVEKPLEYYWNNIAGTLILLETMRAAGCKKIVFSSSATVYGMDNPVPFKEGYPISATNPYGYTKVMIEQILQDLCHADPSWSAVLLRYFNPIGAHESGLIGESPNGIPNNLLPYIAQVADGVLPELKVYGDDYDTPDGTGVRDYIHVVDLAKGHLAALDYAVSYTGAEPFNLGTGHGTSVLEMVQAFEKTNNVRVPYKIVSRRAGDIAAAYADTSKAERVLHWHAEKGITEMCQDSWKFIQHSR
ncbi:MAG: UDP-glucose 4-epimerase GalE [Oscillospiraceae bacterium]|nr:UDP-glucose 4-epimerase GalE [Oscillospiraceae bacterium]